MTKEEPTVLRCSSRKAVSCDCSIQTHILVQISHLLIHDTCKSLGVPVNSAVDRWPCLSSLSELLRLTQCSCKITDRGQLSPNFPSPSHILYTTVYDVFLLGQRLGELDLVIVQKLLVWHHNQRYRNAERIKNCSRTYMPTNFSSGLASCFVDASYQRD